MKAYCLHIDSALSAIIRIFGRKFIIPETIHSVVSISYLFSLFVHCILSIWINVFGVL